MRSYPATMSDGGGSGARSRFRHDAKVTLAHNANQPINDIDNGDPADPPLGKELHYRLHRRVRVYGE